MDTRALAAEMLEVVRADGQCARQVDGEPDACALRAEARRLARLDGMKIRTARMEDVVAIARTDAAIWQDDVATMRAKLTPRDQIARSASVGDSRDARTDG